MNEKMKQTNLSRLGFWRTEWEEEGKKRMIEISYRKEGDFRLAYSEYTDGELVDEVIYSPSGWWVGHWLVLSGDKRLFYIESADDKRMIFGEANTNVVGDIKWQREFERIHF